MENMGNGHNILVEKSEGKITLRRPKSRWDDIKMDLKEIVLRVWTGFTCIRIGSREGLL
jgi:hypothetical protein